MGDSRTRVLVLYGGRSSEHSISFVSAGSVLSALDLNRLEPIPGGIPREGAGVGHPGIPERMTIENGRLPQIDPGGERVTISLDPERPGVWFDPSADGGQVFEAVDVVFPVLHGPHGEDGSLQGLLDIAGLPYVGSGVLSSAACMDKATTKRLLQAAGIPAGAWHSFTPSEWGGAESGPADVVAGLGWPLFSKPTRAG